MNSMMSFLRRKFLSLTLFLLTFLFGLFSPAFAQSADAFQLTGTVTDQNGNGIENVSVTATDPGGSTIQFGPSFTAANGSYVLNIDAGTYDIHFDPSSGFNPIVQSSYIVSSNQVLSVQLAASTHTLSGTVRDFDGNPVSGWRVMLLNSAGNFSAVTDANGHYAVTPEPNKAYSTR